jgi:maleate cis-trans isomerase
MAVRLGVVVPSSNVVMEPELTRMAPPSVSLHHTRAWYRFGSKTDPRPLDPLPELAEDTVRAVPLLAAAGVRAIASGSTAGSCFGGDAFEEELVRRMEAQAEGVRAVTPSGAVVRALRALGARTVSVATSYLDALTEREVAFLQARGFEVVSAHGMRVADGGDMASIPEADTDAFVRAHADRSADALFVSCTNLHTAGLIERWEADLGLPVVTSNAATLWALLGLAEVDDGVAGYGALLARTAGAPA